MIFQPVVEQAFQTYLLPRRAQNVDLYMPAFLNFVRSQTPTNDYKDTLAKLKTLMTPAEQEYVRLSVLSHVGLKYGIEISRETYLENFDYSVNEPLQDYAIQVTRNMHNDIARRFSGEVEKQQEILASLLTVGEYNNYGNYVRSSAGNWINDALNNLGVNLTVAAAAYGGYLIAAPLFAAVPSGGALAGGTGLLTGEGAAAFGTIGLESGSVAGVIGAAEIGGGLGAAGAIGAVTYEVATPSIYDLVLTQAESFVTSQVQAHIIRGINQALNPAPAKFEPVAPTPVAKKIDTQTAPLLLGIGALIFTLALKKGS